MIPSHTSYAVAKHRHQERLDHAATIREIQQARRDGTLRVDRPMQRRLTAARLAHVLAVARTALHL